MNFDFMNSTGPKDSMYRFKWVGNDMLRVMNPDGMEILVNIT